jgi:hypothetical protein
MNIHTCLKFCYHTSRNVSNQTLNLDEKLHVTQIFQKDKLLRNYVEVQFGLHEQEVTGKHRNQTCLTILV